MLTGERRSGFYPHLQGGGVIHGLQKRFGFPRSGFRVDGLGFRASKQLSMSMTKKLHPDPKSSNSGSAEPCEAQLSCCPARSAKMLLKASGLEL